MLRTCAALLALLLAMSFVIRVSTSEQASPAAIRLEQWRTAVEAHSMGTTDEAARALAEWSAADLLLAINSISRSGLPNRTLTRGAVLHFDVSMLLPAKATGPLFPQSGNAPVTFLVLDGRRQGTGSASTHLQFARALLDGVTSGPAAEESVRLWYTVTAAYLAQHHNLAEAVTHLGRARKLFPHDAEILLASGCLHETFAAPRVQSVVRAGAGVGKMLIVGSERENLATAERFFRQALQANPKLSDARLRLGRVIGLQGRHKDAIAELHQVLAASKDPTTTYYALLFLGREEEVLGRVDAARRHFELAASLFPSAQSPYLALGRLAFHHGDARAAERATKQVFGLSDDEKERHDPWWQYDAGTGRYGDALRKALYETVKKELP